MAAALVLALPPASRADGKQEREKRMAEAVAVGRVESFVDAGGPSAELKMADGTALAVPRDDQRFTYWAQKLAKDQASRALVYVAYDSSSRHVTEVLPTARQRVERVDADPAGDRLGVQLFMSPSKHYVLTTRPGHAERKARLEAAAASKEELLVTTDLTELQILDARPLPPAN
ncbi:MAG: hypothetical protein ABW221_17325 [Vicinamibacteria bacterium]